MAQSRERESLDKVLVHEGQVNHPADPGGPTHRLTRIPAATLVLTSARICRQLPPSVPFNRRLSV
jgi:hypothetical protein